LSRDPRIILENRTMTLFKSLSTAIGAAMALALTGAAAFAAVGQSPDQAAVQAVTDNWGATFARGDLAAISKLYTDEAKLLPPNGAPVSGRAAILAYFEKNLRPVMPASIKFTSYEIYGGGSAATSVSRMEMFDAKGRVVERGKQTIVLLKQDGRWKIHRDMWSDDTPVARTN
jgi:uncharacterized protein (TIGR02246 family)